MCNSLPPLFLTADLFYSLWLSSLFVSNSRPPLLSPLLPAIIQPPRDAPHNKAVRSQSRLINKLFLPYSQWGTAPRSRSISLGVLQEVFGWRFVYQIPRWEMGLQCSTRHAKYTDLRAHTRDCVHTHKRAQRHFAALGASCQVQRHMLPFTHKLWITCVWIHKPGVKTTLISCIKQHSRKCFCDNMKEAKSW